VQSLVKQAKAVLSNGRTRLTVTGQHQQLAVLQNAAPDTLVVCCFSQGEYQLLDIIGKGAFGCAYKARHLPTGRLVCIKTLETPAGSNQDEALARQKREVAVLAALALHPNIIR
jgi:serine/threonine protein kinase